MQCRNPECPFWADDPPLARKMDVVYASVDHEEQISMASNEADTIKGMLQGLEHTLSALDAASAAATQLIEAQRSGKPALTEDARPLHRQFAALTKQREHMRTVIARWWTLLEERPH
jgi:chromosome segregation ATPase